jgi:hypothetical protein
MFPGRKCWDCSRQSVLTYGPVVHLHLQCRISWGGKEYTIFKLLSTCAFHGRKNTFTCDMSLQDNKICLLIFCWINNSEIFHNKNRAFRYSYQKTRNHPIKTILRNCKIFLQTRKVTEKKTFKMLRKPKSSKFAEILCEQQRFWIQFNLCDFNTLFVVFNKVILALLHMLQNLTFKKKLKNLFCGSQPSNLLLKFQSLIELPTVAHICYILNIYRQTPIFRHPFSENSVFL